MTQFTMARFLALGATKGFRCGAFVSISLVVVDFWVGFLLLLRFWLGVFCCGVFCCCHFKFITYIYPGLWISSISKKKTKISLSPICVILRMQITTNKRLQRQHRDHVMMSENKHEWKRWDDVLPGSLPIAAAVGAPWWYSQLAPV